MIEINAKTTKNQICNRSRGKARSRSNESTSRNALKSLSKWRRSKSNFNTNSNENEASSESDGESSSNSESSDIGTFETGSEPLRKTRKTGNTRNREIQIRGNRNIESGSRLSKRRLTGTGISNNASKRNRNYGYHGVNKNSKYYNANHNKRRKD